MSQIKAEYVKSQGQTRRHLCHWPNCNTTVPPSYWGCSKHWFTLPANLRAKIWQTYRIGQEKDMKPSKEYIEASKEVQEWIKTYLQYKNV